MTDSKVEQVDREAAAKVYALLGFGPCQHIIDGVEDDIGVVQAFAAHRLATLSQPPVLDEREGWQPIETAPKDGTDVLAWVVHPNARYANGLQGQSDWQGPVVARWIDHNGGGWTWHGLLGTFTHWRPIIATAIRNLGGPDDVA